MTSDAQTAFFRRPIVGLVTAYMLGTAVGLSAMVTPPTAAFAALALALAALAVGRQPTRPSAGPRGVLLRFIRGPGATLATLSAAICAGAASAALHRAEPLNAPALGTQLILRGSVCDTKPPVVIAGGKSRMMHFTIRAGQVHAPSGDALPMPTTTVPAVLFTGPRGPFPVVGETWCLEGSVEADRNRGHGAAAWRLAVRGDNAHRERDAGGFLGLCLRARHAAAQRVALGIDDFPQAVGVLRAILLGYRTELDSDLRNSFASTGTLHVFAISGLHVGIFCGVVVFALSICRVSRVYWVLFLAPLAIGYTLATGARASAVRACIMAIIYFAAPLLGRRADPFSALAAAALLILAWRPDQLFDAGFIFSFSVVGGLLVLYPLFSRELERFWRPDPLAPEATDAHLSWRRQTSRYVCSLVALTCAAWLTSLPLSAHYFGRFSPIALLGNVLVIPMAFLIVVSGCLSLVFGILGDVFSEIFNHANLATTWLLARTIETLAAVPLGNMQVPNPPAWTVAAYYTALASAAHAWKHRRKPSPRS